MTTAVHVLTTACQEVFTSPERRTLLIHRVLGQCVRFLSFYAVRVLDYNRFLTDGHEECRAYHPPPASSLKPFCLNGYPGKTRIADTPTYDVSSSFTTTRTMLGTLLEEMPTPFRPVVIQNPDSVEGNLVSPPVESTCWHPKPG